MPPSELNELVRNARYTGSDIREARRGRAIQTGRLRVSAASASSIRAAAPTDRLPELSRLAALLARTVLDAQIQGRPVPDDQIRFLLDAALLLNEYGAELPSPLDQIMQDASAPKAPEPSDDRPAPDVQDDDAGRLAWLLRPFQGLKG